MKAAVNTTLAVTVDGQDFGQAMKQNLIMAGIGTAAAFGAHKIGDLHKPDASADAGRGSSGGGSSSAAAAAEPIYYAAHKALHLGLGATLSAATAAATGQDVGLGATSGGFGALVGSVMTEML